MAVAVPVTEPSGGDAAGSQVKPRAPARAHTVRHAGERELRLDLFRGLALWLIFIDHVSPDLLTWFTIRNYGLSDAAEIFIFISGYTAALVYGRVLRETGIVVATARILRRVWQIYAAHLLLFLVLMAEIAFVTALSQKQFYLQEMGVTAFFDDPGATVIQTLLLRFRPLNMDVLPLYIVLMAFLPLVLLLARWRADIPLVLAVGLYVFTIRYDLHLSTHPDGFWSFNPYAWQLLFVCGAWCALGGGRRLAPVLAWRPTFWIAVAYLFAAFLLTLTWHFPQLEALVPDWLTRLIYPISKTDLDVLRFAHFAALAVVVLRFTPGDWSGLQSPWLKPLILCGQYSLQIFALGVALAFAGYALLMEASAGWALHVLVGAAGILALYGVARMFTWYKWATMPRERPVSVAELTAQRP